MTDIEQSIETIPLSKWTGTMQTFVGRIRYMSSPRAVERFGRRSSPIEPARGRHPS